MNSNTINEKLTFFYYWEEKLWDDKVNANKYFGTISLLMVAIIGAFTGGGNALKSMFDMNTDLSVIASGGLCILICGLNIGESIVASADAWTAFKRSMLMLLCIAATYFISGVLAVLVIIVVTAVVAIWLGLTLLGGLLNSSSSSGGGGGSQASPERYDTEDGPQSGNMSIDERTLYGDNGKTYHRESIYGKFKDVD